MKIHPTSLEKYNGNLKDLARDVSDLRYDALAEFINELTTKIKEDSARDKAKGYQALSMKLHLISKERHGKKYKVEHIDKYSEWFNDYQDSYTWKEFDENFLWCDKCNSYNEGPCICYAR